jgi:NTP pyrophosphohydrolases including oxidative damage repair enzymes
MSSNSPNPADYRPCVGIILRNDAGLLFFGERSDAPGAWQMPQGGIDDGESVEQAAIRELGEEIGTTNARIARMTADWHYYDFPAEMQKKKWRGKWLGQRQRWVLADFTGQDSDIDLTADDHQEFSQWRWASAEDVLAGIVGFKRPVYQAVLAELLD